jgi:hypothetical protein
MLVLLFLCRSHLSCPEKDKSNRYASARRNSRRGEYDRRRSVRRPLGICADPAARAVWVGNQPGRVVASRFIVFNGDRLIVLQSTVDR